MGNMVKKIQGGCVKNLRKEEAKKKNKKTYFVMEIVPEA